MLKLEFVIGFALASEWMLEMIDVLLDNQLEYCCGTGVLQAWVMYPSVQARKTGRGGKNFLAGIVAPPRYLRCTL